MQLQDERGRNRLIGVTLTALAHQIIKLGSRGVFLHQWPTAGQWGQLALVVWLVISLWEGKEWARIATALFYSLATLLGAVATAIIWSKVGVALRIVTLLTLVITAGISATLWFSDAVRAYMAAQRLREPRS